MTYRPLAMPILLAKAGYDSTSYWEPISRCCKISFVVAIREKGIVQKESNECVSLERV